MKFINATLICIIVTLFTKYKHKPITCKENRRLVIALYYNLIGCQILSMSTCGLNHNILLLMNKALLACSLVMAAYVVGVLTAAALQIIAALEIEIEDNETTIKY